MEEEVADIDNNNDQSDSDQNVDESDVDSSDDSDYEYNVSEDDARVNSPNMGDLMLIRRESTCQAYSQLPLLFANAQPQHLDSISQSELEQFVTFMISCCPRKRLDSQHGFVPEWWPEDFPFRYPLVQRSHWIKVEDYPPQYFRTPVTRRHLMLKSLVCLCYGFYQCEFLLDLSVKLAEMNLVYIERNNNVFIYERHGSIRIKCKEVNVYYDRDPTEVLESLTTHWRHFIIPPPHEILLLDLSRDVNEPPRKKVKTRKRASTRVPASEGATTRGKRLFLDLPDEIPEPEELPQSGFMEKLGLWMADKSAKKEKEVLKKGERKRMLIDSVKLLSLTSTRTQELLVDHTFNLDASMCRIDKYTSLNPPEDNKVATRASTSFQNSLREDAQNQSPQSAKTRNDGDKDKWFHTYKWSHRTRNVRYRHQGGSALMSIVSTSCD